MIVFIVRLFILIIKGECGMYFYFFFWDNIKGHLGESSVNFSSIFSFLISSLRLTRTDYFFI